MVSNNPDYGRVQVEKIQVSIESGLIHPLIRGRDVNRWIAIPSLHILVPQDPTNPMHGYPEAQIAVDFPKTYSYLVRYRSTLLSRKAYVKHLQPSGEPFYSLYSIKHYTFAPFKVVWREIASTFITAVIEAKDRGGNLPLPDHKLVLIDFKLRDEAHFACAVLNSSIASSVVRLYCVETNIPPSVLDFVPLPRFDRLNPTHRALSTLSQRAHALAAEIHDDSASEAAQEKAQAQLAEVEAEIDEQAAELWGLTAAELKEIQRSLEELG